MHIIGFNAMKALENMQTHLISQIGIYSAKTSILLHSNALFSKNVVKCAKTRCFALKTCFMHIIRFNAMKALGSVETQ